MPNRLETNNVERDIAKYLLRTERLDLRLAQMEDADNLLLLHTDDTDAIRFIAWQPTNIVEVRTYLHHQHRRFRRGEDVLWTIQLRDDQEFIGFVDLANIHDNGAEVHFFIARPYWRRGIVSEALAAVIAFAHEGLGIRRISGECDIENTPSERVFQKNGFYTLGIVPKVFRGDIRDFQTFTLVQKPGPLQPPADEITSRPATEDDRSFVEDVYFQTQRWLIEQLFGWRGGAVEKAKFAEIYLEAHSQVLVLDGLRIGWLTLIKEDGGWELDGIYLSPDYQGQGIGTYLVSRIVQQAETAGVPVRLSTAKVNPAKGLYSRLGFQQSHEDEFKVYMEWVPIGTTIRGRSVTLRRASEADIEILAGWFSDQRFVTWWGGKPKSRDEVSKKYLGNDPARDPFIVEADGEPIGYIQAWSDSPPDDGIDIVLKPEAQGRGLGVDAVRTLATHLRSIGWQKITIDPLSENHRAIKAFEKAGFAMECREGEHTILAFTPATIR